MTPFYHTMDMHNKSTLFFFKIKALGEELCDLSLNQHHWPCYCFPSKLMVDMPRSIATISILVFHNFGW
jgi:hypothetical protein